jgi:urea transport system permease protein
MGVINMAHGEFMMVGAFTTYVVSEAFKHLPGGWYGYYPIAAVPAAFIAAGLVGLLCELLVVRHLYGRPLETLLATWGIGLILIQTARVLFGDTLSVTPPSWMEGGLEVAPDLILARNRVFIILYCVICIAVVHLLVNRTKLGLLLRATTQNRQMAAALGVPTRRIDAMTFAFGAGLAGLAGVAVPLYDKINPGMGQDYVVDSFMVVVVGGVGKLAGVIWAGFAMGFLGKYLEPLLQSFKPMASSASVIGKVVVLALIVVFLQWRPSGLFPPKGRLADA